MIPAFFGGLVVGFLLAAALLGGKPRDSRSAPEPISSAFISKMMRDQEKKP